MGFFDSFDGDDDDGPRRLVINKNFDLGDWRLQPPDLGSIDATRDYRVWYKRRGGRLYFKDIEGGNSTPGTDASRCELYLKTPHSERKLTLPMRVRNILGERICVTQVFGTPGTKGNPLSMVHVYKNGDVISRVRGSDGKNTYKTLGTVKMWKWFTLSVDLSGRDIRIKLDGQDTQKARLAASGPYHNKLGLYGVGAESEVEPRWGS